MMRDLGGGLLDVQTTEVGDMGRPVLEKGKTPEWGVELSDGVLACFMRKETMPPKRSIWRAATAWLWCDSGSA